MLKDIINSLQESNTTEQNGLVRGYGRMNADTARRTSIRRLEDAISALKSDNEYSWSNAYNTLYGSGVLEEIMKTMLNNSSNDPRG